MGTANQDRKHSGDRGNYFEIIMLKPDQRAKKRKEQLKTFDENTITINGRILGLPFTEDCSELVVIMAPWETTVSYGEGTANGPEAILETSTQIDLYDKEFHNVWKSGIFLSPAGIFWKKKSKDLRKVALPCLDYMASHNTAPKDPRARKNWDKINQASVDFNKWIKNESLKYLKNGQLAAIVGGEHSVSFGLLEALSDFHPSFGILHIDTHLDMRKNFSGFEFSHAAAMYNASKIKNVKKIVNVGARDFCQEEMDYVKNSRGKIAAFTDWEISQEKYRGKSCP